MGALRDQMIAMWCAITATRTAGTNVLKLLLRAE
jgi:hypothetical protein